MTSETSAPGNMLSHYIEDFRRHWRPLVGASLGMCAGAGIFSYITSTMAPHYVENLGWTRAEFALLGTMSILMLFAFPVIGRLADLYGVRRVASVGFVTAPLLHLATSMLTGPIEHYVVILTVQFTLGVMTTAAVMTRLVVQYFDRSRGGALAVVVSSPALVGAVGSPLLAGFIEMEGWRAGLQAVAVFSAVIGFLAFLIIPKPTKLAGSEEGEDAVKRSFSDYGPILRSRVFWLIFLGAFLVSLPQVLTNSQMVLAVTDSGGDAELAAFAVSVFAIGVVIGRIIAGLALDKFSAEWVAAIGLSLPGFGMILMATPFDAPFVIAGSVFLIGLAFGAEGDVLAYLNVKYFGVRIYSTVTGLVWAAIGGAQTVGAIMLSQALRLTDSFAAFLIIAGIGVLIGCYLLLLLRKMEPIAA